MKEKQHIAIYEKKLEALKEEEALIMELLSDVRDQLNRYKVELLQIASVRTNENGTVVEDSDSEESDEESSELMASKLDNIEEINKKPLELKVEGNFDNFSDEDEEDDEDDY